MTAHSSQTEGFLCRKEYSFKCYGIWKSERLSVYHIIPYRISKSDKLSNLMSLCGSCHRISESSGQQYLKLSVL